MSNASYAIGNISSAVSASMFMQLPSGSMVTFMPSANGVPPQPPAGRSEKTSVVPSASRTPHTNQLQSPHAEPTARSGSALATACHTALATLGAASTVQPMVGAGHLGFSQQSSGRITLMGLNMPSFCGALGSRKNCSE